MLLEGSCPSSWCWNCKVVVHITDNPRVDFEELKKKDGRLTTEKNKLKSYKGKKPPTPDEKGIVIRETNSSEFNNQMTRSQTNSKAGQKNQEKENIDEP